MADDEKDNVVSLRPESPAPDFSIPPGAEPDMADLISLCERLDEGMKYITGVLVQLDTRVRRLELAHNKAEREKPKPVILNAQGKQAN